MNVYIIMFACSCKLRLNSIKHLILLDVQSVFGVDDEDLWSDIAATSNNDNQVCGNSVTCIS